MGISYTHSAMTESGRPSATYEDILAAPPHSIAQIIGGELHVQPRPAGPHNIATSGLSIDLGNPFQRGRGGPGGWIIIYEPELHFDADVVVPDLAAWRTSVPPELEAVFFTIPPVWACEVLSPSNSAFDRGPKADLYLQVGVEYLWLVDPLANLIEALANRKGAWVRLGAWAGEISARIPPFDAVALELGPLWAIKNPELER
jgi:Uma2 family endonuclease